MIRSLRLGSASPCVTATNTAPACSRNVGYWNDLSVSNRYFLAHALPSADTSTLNTARAGRPAAGFSCHPRWYTPPSRSNVGFDDVPFRIRSRVAFGDHRRPSGLVANV